MGLGKLLVAALAGFASTARAVAVAPRDVAAEDTCAASNYNNPVIYEDLADNDVFRVNDTYYYTASTMHYSPGAPILRSYDLANWEYIGHAVPVLNWGSKYSLLNGQRAYIKGIFASTLRYRKSNGLWYWIGCIEYSTTYIFTAPAPQGPWTQRAQLNKCYYDCGLLIDDDDTMYVAYGSPTISVAQLSKDGLSEVKSQAVFSTPSSVGTLEGNRMYKKDGYYYIFSDKPANGQYIMRSSSPFGSYTMAQVALNMPSPLQGSGYPHQGSLVNTASGQWYWMSFLDAYPGGRVPALAPVNWPSGGFPTVQTVNGQFGASYAYPDPDTPVTPMTGTDTFQGSALGPAWEWNHNPDTTKFSVNNGVKLSTATVTTDLYQARNTLTKRIHGPKGTGTVVLDVSGMADGDRAGLSLLRDSSAYIGVWKSGSTYTINYVNGLSMSSTWATTSTGSVSASASTSSTTLSFRIVADIAPGGSHQAQFYYSTDGSTFKQLGGTFTMGTSWEFFMGYRYGIFNFATKSLGGSVTVKSFTSA